MLFLTWLLWWLCWRDVMACSGRQWVRLWLPAAPSPPGWHWVHRHSRVSHGKHLLLLADPRVSGNPDDLLQHPPLCVNVDATYTCYLVTSGQSSRELTRRGRTNDWRSNQWQPEPNHTFEHKETIRGSVSDLKAFTIQNNILKWPIRNEYLITLKLLQNGNKE